MSGTSVVQHIDAVDAFARTLHVRTSQSTVPSLSTDASQAVRNLHNALRLLRVEAADPDSRLNAADSSSYLKQLNSIIKDSQTTLKQLELVLDLNNRGGGPYADGAAEGIAAVQTKLVHQQTVIDAFLNLVQSNSAPPSSGRRGPSLEYIKEKVDTIGRKLFRRDSTSKSTANGDDKLWKRFQGELVKEGFSSKVLDDHEVCSVQSWHQVVKHVLKLTLSGCSARLHSRDRDHAVCQRRRSSYCPRPPRT